MGKTDSSLQSRRSGRVNIGCPVRISGLRSNQVPFEEDAHIVTVSKFGARMKTRIPLKVGMHVTVQPLLGKNSGVFKIVWVGREGSLRAGEVGVEYAEETADILGINFNEPSTGTHTGSPVGKATSSSADLSTTPSLCVPPCPEEKAGRAQPREVAAAVRMNQNGARREIAGPLPKPSPTVYGVPSLLVSGDAASAAQSRKPLSFILIGGIASLLLAVSTLSGWHGFHRKAQSAPIQVVTAQPVHPSAPIAEIAVLPLELVDISSSAPALPEVKPQAPARARKHRRVKAAKAVNPAPPAPSAAPQTAQLVNLQSLALEALAEGNYAEPREGNAIVYSQQALALNPSSGYSWTLLKNSVKGGEHQIRQAILNEDFTSAHRLADELAQLLTGESAVRELEADLARAEKKAEDPQRTHQVPAAVLSFSRLPPAFR